MSAPAAGCSGIRTVRPVPPAARPSTGDGPRASGRQAVETGFVTGSSPLDGRTGSPAPFTSRPSTDTSTFTGLTVESTCRVEGIPLSASACGPLAGRISEGRALKSALWASSSVFSPRASLNSGFDACRATRIPDLPASASTTTSPRPQRPRSSLIAPPPSWTVRFTAPLTSRRALSNCSGFALTCATTFSPPRSNLRSPSVAGWETPGPLTLSSPVRPSPALPILALSTLAGSTVTGPRPLSLIPAGNRTTLSAPKDCRRSSRSSPSHWPVCTDSGAMCTRTPVSVGITSTCTRPSEPGFRETCSLPPPTFIRPSAVPAIRFRTVARRLSVRIAGCRADAPPARTVSARSPPEIRSVPDTTLSSNDWEWKFQIGSASTGTGPVGGGRVRTTPSDPLKIGIDRSGKAEECGLAVSCFSASG